MKLNFIDRTTDAWQAAPDADAPAPAANLLLSLEQWQAVRGAWPEGLAVGVRVPNTADIETLADDLPRLALVALEFPKWVDGRAYSQAHVLRGRLRFAGEIRATGDVVVDMMPLLARNGFDAVVLREGQRQSSATSGTRARPAPELGRARAEVLLRVLPGRHAGAAAAVRPRGRLT
jgi:uncharacterized protein (DUF934 family)